MKFEFSAIVVVYWTALLTSLYKVTLNTEIEENSEKISRFSRCALRPALGVFLRDIGAKIAGIPQCRALGTTLHMFFIGNI